MLYNESEKFGGDVLLGGEESLHEIKLKMEGWTDHALKVFNRHRGEDGANYPDHDEMLKMNEVLILQYLTNCYYLTRACIIDLHVQKAYTSSGTFSLTWSVKYGPPLEQRPFW